MVAGVHHEISQKLTRLFSSETRGLESHAVSLPGWNPLKTHKTPDYTSCLSRPRPSYAPVAFNLLACLSVAASCFPHFCLSLLNADGFLLSLPVSVVVALFTCIFQLHTLFPLSPCFPLQTPSTLLHLLSSSPSSSRRFIVLIYDLITWLIEVLVAATQMVVRNCIWSSL